ncbi:unnamed protein product [Heterobilharzia americana]|nr:unnamed protein product [Heterobilharzia americana]
MGIKTLVHRKIKKYRLFIVNMPMWKTKMIKFRRSPLLCIILLILFMAMCYHFLTRRNVKHEFKSNIHSDQLKPIIFVGGYPRSGTTLMRVLLDVHPMIRCGPETRVIPKLLTLRETWSKGIENERLQAAHLYPEPIDSATRSFIWSIIKNAGEDAPVLCNKDPLTFIHLAYLANLFPEAKFVHMVRDGRAVINSLMKRNVRIRGSPNNTLDKFLAWEKRVSQFLHQCEIVGSKRCKTIKYESLVLKPTKILGELFEFLHLEWDPVVLHHEKAMNNNGLSMLEPSTSQVVHPIH